MGALVAVSVVIALLAAGVAQPDPALAVWASGYRSQQVEAHLRQQLAASHSVLSAERTAELARRMGSQGSWRSLSAPRWSVRTGAAVARAAQRVGAGAVVRLHASRRGRQVTLSAVLAAADGSAILARAQRRCRPQGLLGAAAALLVEDLLPALAPSPSPPEADAIAPVVGPARQPPAGVHVPSKRTAPEVGVGWELELSGAVAGRRFAYTDRISAGLGDYTSSPSLAVRGRAALHLLRWQSAAGNQRQLGLSLQGERQRAQRAVVAGREGAMRALQRAWAVGLVWRLELRPVQLAWHCTYGRLDALVGRGEVGGLPSVRYGIAALEARATWNTGRRLMWIAEAGYGMVLSASDMKQRFPRAAIGALSAEGGVGWRLGAALDLRTTVHYRHIFYDMRSQPGDGLIAGGALDQMISFHVGVHHAL